MFISIFNGKERRLGANAKDDIYLKIDAAMRGHLHHFKGAKLGVFMAIALHTNADGWAFPSRELLSKETGYTINTVSETIGELCQLEIEGHRVLLSRQKTEKGVFKSNQYLIFPTAADITLYEPGGQDQPTSETTIEPQHTFPYTEKPYTVKPYTEKPVTKKNHLKLDPSLRRTNGEGGMLPQPPPQQLFQTVPDQGLITTGEETGSKGKPRGRKATPISPEAQQVYAHYKATFPNNRACTIDWFQRNLDRGRTVRQLLSAITRVDDRGKTADALPGFLERMTGAEYALYNELGKPFPISIGINQQTSGDGHKQNTNGGRYQPQSYRAPNTPLTNYKHVARPPETAEEKLKREDPNAWLKAKYEQSMAQRATGS